MAKKKKKKSIPPIDKAELDFEVAMQNYRPGMPKKEYESGGAVTRDSRDGYARGGLTKVPRQDDSTALMQAGGYLGGLTETGRGTMAGELRPRGDMSVREAGETMHELARRRGYAEGGGIGFTASNVLRDAVSATLTKKKKKKKEK